MGMRVSAAFARLAGLIAIGDSPISTSPFHLTAGELRQRCALPHTASCG